MKAMTSQNIGKTYFTNYFMGLKISDGLKGCGCTTFELNVSLQV